MIERIARLPLPAPSEERGRIRSAILTIRRWAERRFPEPLYDRVASKFYDEIMQHGCKMVYDEHYTFVPKTTNYVAYFTSDDGNSVYRGMIIVTDGTDRGFRVQQIRIEISDEEIDYYSDRRIAIIAAWRTNRNNDANTCPVGIDDSGVIEKSTAIRRGNSFGEKVRKHEAAAFLNELLSAKINHGKTQEFMKLEEECGDNSRRSLLRWISSPQ